MVTQDENNDRILCSDDLLDSPFGVIDVNIRNKYDGICEPQEFSVSKGTLRLGLSEEFHAATR